MKKLKNIKGFRELIFAIQGTDTAKEFSAKIKLPSHRTLETWREKGRMKKLDWVVPLVILAVEKWGKK